MAAKQGGSSSQFNLGLMYEKGRGVAQSGVKALRWYRKTADRGDYHLKIHLDYICRKCRGAIQSDVEAGSCCGKAADTGNSYAQGTLGTM
jgi:hypothetical protein